MTRVLFSLMLMVFLPLAANGASMCIHPGSGTSTNQASGNADNNLGYWNRGGRLMGEAHCSAVGMIGPDTTEEQFQKGGNNCYCRITQVAAPNGYMANRTGGWVLYYDSSGCATNCANHCTSYVGSYRGFRRALSVSPRP